MDPNMIPSLLFAKQTLIPLTAILCGLALPVLIVWLVLRNQQRRHQQLLETVRHLADRGMPVPRELLDPPQRTAVQGSPMFRAITLVGVGVGLALMFVLLNLAFLAGIGALLVCIGVAQLVALRLEPAPRADADPGA